MQTSSNNSWLFKNHFLKGRKFFKNLKKKKIEIFFLFLWELKTSLAQIFKRLLLPRNNECSAQHTKVTIRNWATFCGIAHWLFANEWLRAAQFCILISFCLKGGKEGTFQHACQIRSNDIIFCWSQHHLLWMDEILKSI